MSEKILVIGGGPGGYVAAIRAAQLGGEVTLVEKQYFGGTCLNVGCIPTKCLLHSAELLEEVKTRGPKIGIIADNITVDFEKVMKNKAQVTKKLTGGVAGLLKANGVQTIAGTAEFTGPKQVKVVKEDGTEEEIAADKIIVSTGSINTVPPIPGLKENPNCIDSTGALALTELPESMIVIGGGVIGMEIACAYAAFGTKITIIEAQDHVLPMLDSDLTAVGLKRMKKMKINIVMSSPVQSVEESEVGAKVICKNAEGEEVAYEAAKVLVAVGRKANTGTINLEASGLDSERGAILVNDKMETSVEGVYAIGDCVKGYSQLAHTASAMGEVAAENALGGDSHYEESTCPTCVYIEPEAASVGLTEDKCKAEGIPYKAGTFPMMGNGKALILNGGEGIVKIIADPESNKVLGMHIIGPRATDLISEGAFAIKMGATIDDLIETIHSHPTVTEAVREAALAVEKRSIHNVN